MCGIVGLFAKSPEVEERLGAHLGAMLGQMADRGPDSAGLAIYRDPAPLGSTKVSLYAGRRPRGAGRRRRPRRGRRARGARAPGRARDERGHADRDHQGGRRPAPVRRALRPRGHGRLARPRAHAHGDREQGHDGGRAPVLHRARPLPRPQRLALEPQRAAAQPAPRGDPLPDGERHGGRRGLPRVAAARGRHAAGRARGVPRRPRRLLHVRDRHRRRVRRAARPDRLQARRDGRERRLGGDGLRVPRDRRAARAPTPPRCGSPSRRTCTRGSGNAS